MSGVPIPTLVLLAAATLALLLEGIGARPGERKRIGRHHLSAVVVVAAVVCVIAAALVEPWSLWPTVGIATALITWAACEDQPLGEQAALALGLGALTALFAIGPTPTPLEIMVCVVGSTVVLGALATRQDGPDSDAAVEASTRQLFSGACAAVLVGVGAMVPGTDIGVASLLAGLALAVGLAPLHGTRVDVAQGAPAGVFALGALPLVALGPVLARVVVAAPPVVSLVVCAVGCVGLPLVALAQVSMRRLLAVLGAMQPTLVVAAAVVGADVEVAAGLGGVAVAGLAAASWALPSLSRPLASWEDTSGAGRLMPWRAGLVIFVAAFACGLPPTAGFALRRSLAVAAGTLPSSSPDGTLASYLPLLLVGGGAIAALPVVRLALFLFAKTPRVGTPAPARTPAFLVLGAIVAFAVVVGAVGFAT